MILIVAWLIFALVVGSFASSKGRSFFLWTLVSLIFSPLIGFIIVALLSNSKDAERRHKELLAAVKEGKVNPQAIMKR